MMKQLFVTLAAVTAAAQLAADVTAIGNSRNGYPLIVPQPKELVPAAGSFALPAELTVAAPENFDLAPLAKAYAATVKGGKVTTGEKAVCRFELTKNGVPESVEGYTLNVDSDGIVVKARDVRGLFYGMQTLVWMLRNREGDALKECAITDWPDLEMRGLFFELPRISPSKVDRLCEIIDVLANLKYNLILIEFADNLPMKDSPYTGRKETFSFADVDKILAAAKRNHIELIPKLQVASHTLWMTNHRDWAKLSEGKVVKPWSSLYCLSNPAVQPVVEDLVRETAEIVKPRYFHLGLDEISHCGYPICPKCRKANLTQLLLNHVKPIKKLLNDRGITPIIYQDEFFSTLSGMRSGKSKPMADFPEKLGTDVMINSWEYSVEPTTMTGKSIRARGFKDLIYMSYSKHPDNCWKLPKVAKENNAHGNILAYWYSAPATLDDPERTHYTAYPSTIAQANYAWNTTDVDFNRIPIDSAAVLRNLVNTTREYAFKGKPTAVVLAGVFNRTLDADPQFPHIDAKIAQQVKTIAAADRAKFDVPVLDGKVQAAILSGSPEDGYAVKPVTIPVGVKASGAAFLMAASIFNTFTTPDAKIGIGEIRVVYADGKNVKVPLVLRDNINDWNTYLGGNRSRAVLRGNDADGALFTLYSVEWVNPHPEKVIREIVLASNKKCTVATALFALSLADADGTPAGLPAAAPEISAVPARKSTAAMRPLFQWKNGIPAGTRKNFFAVKGFKSRTVDDPGEGKVLEITVNETTDQPARVCIDLPVKNEQEFKYLVFKLNISDIGAVSRADIYWLKQFTPGEFHATAALGYASVFNSGVWQTVCLPRSRFNEKEHGGIEIPEATLLRISFFLRSPIKPLKIRIGDFGFTDEPTGGRVNLNLPAL